MSMIRRDPESSPWPEVFDRGLLFDWPFHPTRLWRRMLSEDEIKVEELYEGRELVVRAEIAGVDPDRDIDVSISEGMLQIRAERRQEHKVEQASIRRSELRYGAFSRTLPLPPGTAESDIKASYKDGILEVRVPVLEGGSKTSKILISRS